MTESSQKENALQRHVSLRSGTLLVLANIIGAGIFTTTGYQAADLGHPGFIFLLWFLGGLLAICGALCYAELGAAMPHDGAEYVYLRHTYGGLLGFMSAFVSLFAGFSAPIASAAKGFSRYLSYWFPSLSDPPVVLGVIDTSDCVAIAIVWLLIAIQMRGSDIGLRFSDGLTFFKVLGILGIIVAAAAIGQGDIAGFTSVSATYEQLDNSELFSAMATSLIFVMFCYSGWNASAYIAGEFKNPQRDLPPSLIIGTGLVMALYLGINAVYFYGASVDEMAGVAEVGLVAAKNLFGPVGVNLVTVVLCASLLASATAMTIVGPRVSIALGRDYKAFRFLSVIRGSRGVPANALILQGLVTSIIIVSGRIDQIMQYAGFTLALFASLAVSCVIVLRIRSPDMPRPFRTWGYPLTPILFLSVSGWMMFWAFQGRPVESTLGLLTAALGGVVFFATGTSRAGGRKYVQDKNRE
jgi:APA family basic amino acid/polyamine antiporter